ncbi:MAG: hypothetical protein ACKVII_27995 [Planctomycetales bacterium]|jgi:hypothetical protein
MVLEAGELAAMDAADHYDSSFEETDAAAEESASETSDERAEAWRAYRDGHKHWATIRKSHNTKQNRMRLGIIRAAFIRDSHSRDDAYSG